ncbi:MAG: DegV family protein [Oscillospiraceae bacterium]|nr:DegV family protein [Oscillospiraceae bacterium]
MNIKIISDSTCDLSPALLEEYNISLVPLTVIKADEEFKDGITITPADIFAHVANGGSLCTTSANSVGEYQDVFEKYAKDYDGVIHINIGSGFSSCYQNACLAAEDYSNVRVIDSMNLSTGQGLVVLKACDLAKNLDDLDEIVAQLNEFTGKVESSFLLDQLKYMVKGGRCSSVVALGANLLNLKPCIEVKDGKMAVVKKYRGNYAKCLANYVKDRLAGRSEELSHDHLFITHTPVTEDCYSAVLNVVHENNYFNRIHETNAGCTVSCHCGPGTLGVLFVRK